MSKMQNCKITNQSDFLNFLEKMDIENTNLEKRNRELLNELRLDPLKLKRCLESISEEFNLSIMQKISIMVVIGNLDYNVCKDW